METSFLNEKELRSIGLASYGKNVLISRKASIYSPETIALGDYVRIDDFCILSGQITIGNRVHISAYTALYGRFGIEIGDFSGISPRCTLLSATDDFSGAHLMGPMAPEGSTHVTGGRIILGHHVQLGAGCIVMPGITFGEGSATGSMSLINKDTSPWGIYIGIPAKRIRERSKELLKFVI